MTRISATKLAYFIKEQQQCSRRWPKQLATLQSKTALIIATTLVGLLVMVYVPLQLFLLGGFVTLEQQIQRTNLERAVHALWDSWHSLDAFNISHSSWDDTYNFVQRPNELYVVNNWYDTYFADSQLNLLVITDTAGRTLYSKAFDLQAQRAIAVPQRFLQLAPNDPLLQLDPTGEKIGVVLLPDNPMLISARPILTSLKQGPSVGTLIVGRYLDAHEVERLSDITQVALTVHRLDQEPSAELRALQAQLAAGAPSIISAPNAEVINGYAHIPDLDAGLGLLLQVQSPRSIYAHGLISVRSFVVALLTAGAMFGLVTLLLLRQVVLKRLSALSTGLQQIGNQSELNARLTVDGHDELSDLARTVNGMLLALEQAQLERQQAAAVREQMRLQEENLRSKREFISLVSHELRTPLTPIKGFTDLLLLDKDELTPDQNAALQAVKANTLRLELLVNDLLDLGQLDTNRLTLVRAPLVLGDVASEAAAMLQRELERKQITLIQDIPPALPMIVADYRRLVQILTNLLSNAIKYTYPHGQIWIKVAQLGDAAIEVQVEDTGIGLTSEQQERLFTPFYRADHALHSQENGTGLGLTIVRALVQLHDGHIWVRSAPGVGSTFAFILPLR